MNIVFFDSETTSLDPLFGQMVEFSAIVCDENLRETGEELHLNCRLSPGIIPEPKALLVTSKSIEDINSSKNSHYQMVMQIVAKARQWTPSLWIGWNTIGFDFPYLSASFYKCLAEPYFHQMYENRRGDALAVARAIHTLHPKILKVPTNEKGRNSFRLSDIAQENGINHQEAHSSKADTITTIEICRQLAKGAEDLWQECLQTTKKSDAERLMKSAPLFSYAQSGFGGAKIHPMTQVCYHPKFSYPMGLDISKDPKDYIDLDPDELLEVLRGKPKVLKAIAPNKHPIILDPNRVLNTPAYSFLDMDEALERAKMVKDSKKLKLNIIKALEIEESKKKTMGMGAFGREKEVEELMVRLPFEDTPEDAYRKEEFTRSANWELRAELCEKFEDQRYKVLSRRLVYEGDKNALPDHVQEEIERDILRRTNSKGNVPWNTSEKVKENISKIKHDGEKVGTSLSDKEIRILESLERYIESLSNLSSRT